MIDNAFFTPNQNHSTSDELNFFIFVSNLQLSSKNPNLKYEIWGKSKQRWNKSKEAYFFHVSY